MAIAALGLAGPRRRGRSLGEQTRRERTPTGQILEGRTRRGRSPRGRRIRASRSLVATLVARLGPADSVPKGRLRQVGQILEGRSRPTGRTRQGQILAGPTPKGRLRTAIRITVGRTPVGQIRREQILEGRTPTGQILAGRTRQGRSPRGRIRRERTRQGRTPGERILEGRIPKGRLRRLRGRTPRGRIRRVGRTVYVVGFIFVSSMANVVGVRASLLATATRNGTSTTASVIVSALAMPRVPLHVGGAVYARSSRLAIVA